MSLSFYKFHSNIRRFSGFHKQNTVLPMHLHQNHIITVRFRLTVHRGIDPNY